MAFIDISWPLSWPSGVVRMLNSDVTYSQKKKKKYLDNETVQHPVIFMYYGHCVDIVFISPSFNTALNS